MASTILHKRSSVSGTVPALSSLQVGEIAINIADGNFFTKTIGNVVETFIPKSQNALVFNSSLSSFSFQYGNNIVEGILSVGLQGYNNHISGAGSSVLNGENNDNFGDFSTVGNGINNKILENVDFGFIAGGTGNAISHSNCYVFGSNLSSHAPNYTYAENLSCIGNFSATGTISLGEGEGNNANLCINGDKVGINTEDPTTTLDVSGSSIRIRNTKTPATSSSNGVQGEICWDENYMYVCVAANTWKRIAYSQTGW